MKESKGRVSASAASQSITSSSSDRNRSRGVSGPGREMPVQGLFSIRPRPMAQLQRTRSHASVRFAATGAPCRRSYRAEWDFSFRDRRKLPAAPCLNDFLVHVPGNFPLSGRREVLNVALDELIRDLLYKIEIDRRPLSAPQSFLFRSRIDI